MLVTYFCVGLCRTESLLNFLASRGYKFSKEKGQLCLQQITYLGVVLKWQTHFLSHEGIDPILHFPLPHTIKQLRAFLWITGFWRIWIPRYAALARHLFMLLLIFLLGPCIINAFSRIKFWQVQRIRLQLLVKEYSPLPRHEPSIPFYQGAPWDYMGQPLRKVPFPLYPHCPIVSMK
jgi:hypothetical protein